MAYKKLRYEVADGIATITLDDPDTRNSLSPQLLEELLASLRECRDDDGARCLVLASSHEKVFSSGANLGAFGTDAPITDRHAGATRFIEVFKAIGGLGKPSLVAANGHVLAGSLRIAMACDLIIAKEGATFGTPEINVGLFPFMIMALIYRNVPRKKTNEMLLLGERLSAEEAREAGIVNKVVPADEFDAAGADWARKLASKSPALMKLGKDAVYRQMDMPFDEALDFLRSQLSIAFTTDDVQE